MEAKPYNIENDHDEKCKYYGDGDWSCGESHRTREHIYYLNQRIAKLENALKDRADICDNAICRAKARQALEK